MRSVVLLFFVLTWFSLTMVNGQSIKHTYRFYENLLIAQPQCGPDLTQSKAQGSCGASASPGGYTDDVLPCGVKRKVYHNNLNWGLMYPNTTGTITDNYTIQIYLKVTNWGEEWARIIDFSNGQLDEGIYFKNTLGSSDRCLDFYPFGISGDCPFFSSSTYYLLTFTRNGQTGVMDIYVDNKLFASYKDTKGIYVGKAGTPIYIFRDDAALACDAGEANFAYLSFSDQHSTQADVSSAATQICFAASINAAADFSIDPNPSCGFPKNINIAYTGDIKSPETGYTFKWDWDGGNVVSGTGIGPFVVNWKTPGTKNIKLTITNTACDNSITNIKQAIISSLDLTTSVQSGSCSNSDQATITVTGVNGIAPYTYSIDSVNFQNDAVFKVTPATYRLYVKDANDCVSVKEVKVDSAETTNIQVIDNTTICEGQQVQLRTTGNATSFSWFPATGLDNASAASPVANPVITTVYIVTATRNNCQVQDTVTITVIPKIEVTATPDSNIESGKPFQLNASSPQLDGQQGVSYAWLPPSGLDNPAIANPLATIFSNSTYTVRITSPDGCAGTAKVNLFVGPPASIFVPTAFTPDGDGKNEVLQLVTNSITKLTYFRIYNRWGEVVFFSNQLNLGWDGRFKSAEPVAGPYVFQVEGTTSEGKIIRKEGSVLLIR